MYILRHDKILNKFNDVINVPLFFLDIKIVWVWEYAVLTQ